MSLWCGILIEINSSRRCHRAGVGTLIHYPVPPHLSKAYEQDGWKVGDFPLTEQLADTVLSLPMYVGLSERQVQNVIDGVKAGLMKSCKVVYDQATFDT